MRDRSHKILTSLGLHFVDHPVFFAHEAPAPGNLFDDLGDFGLRVLAQDFWSFLLTKYASRFELSQDKRLNKIQQCKKLSDAPKLIEQSRVKKFL